jgi:hypothetical protein
MISRLPVFRFRETGAGKWRGRGLGASCMRRWSHAAPLGLVGNPVTQDGIEDFLFGGVGHGIGTLTDEAIPLWTCRFLADQQQATSPRPRMVVVNSQVVLRLGLSSGLGEPLRSRTRQGLIRRFPPSKLHHSLTPTRQDWPNCGHRIGNNWVFMVQKAVGSQVNSAQEACCGYLGALSTSRAWTRSASSARTPLQSRGTVCTGKG